MHPCQVLEKGVCTLLKKNLEADQKGGSLYFCALRFTGDLFSARCFAELVLYTHHLKCDCW